jgi:hypothetical protein
MSTSSKWFPLALIGAGILLLVASITTFLILRTEPASASIPIPTKISGYAIAGEETGPAALREFTQMHGKSFPVVAGAKAMYGAGNQVIIWVASTASISDTRGLLEAMRDKIAENNSPFEPTGVQTIGSREVYTLYGMGQKHFYFQSGKYLVWLASNAEIANQALEQALGFYK